MSKHSSAEEKLHISTGLRGKSKLNSSKIYQSNVVQLPPKRANFKNQYR